MGWPSATPRIKTIMAPEYEQWIMAKGAITGVGTASQNSRAASYNGITEGVTALDLPKTRTLRNDVPQMRTLLALARAWYGVPATTARWVNRGIVEYGAALRPGTLITAIVEGNTSTAINAIISRRTWTRVTRGGVDMYDTAYETQRVLPDLESRK